MPEIVASDDALDLRSVLGLSEREDFHGREESAKVRGGPARCRVIGGPVFREIQAMKRHVVVQLDFLESAERGCHALLVLGGIQYAKLFCRVESQQLTTDVPHRRVGPVRRRAHQSARRRIVRIEICPRGLRHVAIEAFFLSRELDWLPRRVSH